MSRSKKGFFAAACAGAALLVFASAAMAADGDFETHFNGTGQLTGGFNPPPASDQIFATAVQPDGKLLIAGTSDGNGWIGRLNTDGTADDTFGGGDGEAEFNSGTKSGAETPRAIALQPNGKILVVGDVLLATTTDFVVARYNDNGTPDMSFDGPGTPGDGIFRILHGTNDIGHAITYDAATDKIDFAGSFDSHSIVYQLNPTDGSLDTSGFGSPNGFLTFDYPGGGGGQSFTNGLTAQSDGKLIAVGNPNQSAAGIGVARITTAGALDSANFNSGGGVPGLITLPPPTPTYIGGVGFQPIVLTGGEILVAGQLAGPINGDFVFPYDPAIAAVTSAGALDTSFATNGYATLSLPGEFDTAYGLAQQPDGKLVIGGDASGTVPSPHNSYFAARFTSGGTLDSTFASPNGYRTTDFGTTAPGNAFAMSTDGVAYVAGGIGSPGASIDFGIAAFRAFTPPSPPPGGGDSGGGTTNPPSGSPSVTPPTTTKKCKKKKHHASAAKKCRKKK